MNDPFLSHILGLMLAGVLSTGFAISGYLQQEEAVRLVGTQLTYPAVYRKVPLAVLGTGLCLASWLLIQDRREWKRQYAEWQQQQERLRGVTHQAELESTYQIAQLQAAERAYPLLQPYLDAEIVDSAAEQPSSMPGAVPPQDSVPSPHSSSPSTPDTVPSGQQAIAVRDLTAEIAQYDGHILVASRTRSGKTTTMQSTIRHASSRHNGQVVFHIFDPKGAAWCGLERGKTYLFCNTPQHVPAVLNRLEELIRFMQARQQERMRLGGHYTPGTEPIPVIIAIDEFNTLLSLAQEYDESFPPKDNPRTQKKIQRYVERFIFQGAEDRVYLWLMAQTTRVEQLGLNTSVQDNMAYFAQSRKGDYQSVEDAISNTYVVSNPTQRRELQVLLTGYRYDASQNLEIPLAFTTLGGNQLCKLPDLAQARYYHITDLAKTTEQREEASEAESDFYGEAVKWLESCLRTELPADDHPLPLHLQKILDYSRRKGWVSASDVRGNVWQCRQHSVDHIREFFRALEQMGKGECRGEESTVQFRVNPG